MQAIRHEKSIATVAGKLNLQLDSVSRSWQPIDCYSRFHRFQTYYAPCFTAISFRLNRRQHLLRNDLLYS